MTKDEGKTFIKKKDGTIQIVMENINNISSNREFNLKLDNGKK